MSLRARLLLAIGIAIAAAIAALVMLGQVVRSSSADNLARAEQDNDAAVAAVARVVPAWVGEPGRAEQQRVLRGRLATVLAPLIDTRGGFCWPDGELLEQRAEPGDRGPPPDFGGPPPDDDRPPPPPFEDRGPDRGPDGGHDRGPPGPPPEVRDAILVACRGAHAGAIEHGRMSRHDETAVIAATAVPGSALVAWTIRTVHTRGDARDPGWRWWLIAGAAMTLVLVALVISIVFALRAGVRELGRTVSGLEHDLRAEVSRPPIHEFAAITSRVEVMATRLADARDRERELERQLAHQARLGALGRLVAGVAHEIRNPLTGVKLLLDGVLDRGTDPRTAEDLTASLGELARLDALVTPLLGVARDPRAQPERVEVAALVDARIAALGSAVAARIERHGSAQAWVEPDVLIRVVDNLIRNALEAAPPDTSVRVELAVTADHQLELAVVDRGPGVPEAKRDQLFEPFFTLKPHGTGLGLWLSHELLTARGGDVRYDRADGTTRFVVHLPTEAP